MAYVHQGEKKNFFIKNTLFKACKKHKKICLLYTKCGRKVDGRGL